MSELEIHRLDPPPSGWTDTELTATVQGRELRVQVADDDRHRGTPIVWARVIARPGDVVQVREAFAFSREHALDLGETLLDVARDGFGRWRP